MTSDEKIVFERLQQLTQQHFDQPLYGIDELCRELGVSRSTLFRLIKENTGLSPSRYIRQERLLSARHLLETTNLRISDIATQVGFNSSQTLSKYFTEAFGQSPSELRKNQEETQASQIGLLSETTPVIPRSPAKTPTRMFQYSRRMWLAGAGLVLAVLLVAWIARRNTISPISTPTETAILVLPFKTLGSEQTRYFSDGVMEQIHNSLTKLENLKVISRTSAMTYGQTTKPITQIAKELSVDYVLEGQVEQLDKHVKLSVELIRASENQTIWSNTYEGDQQAIFTFMGQVSNKIADELNQKLSQLTRQQLSQVPTQNLEAYNEYLKGQYLMRTRTKEGLANSLLNFDRALALDSAFADVYVSKALVYFLKVSEGHANRATYTKAVEKYILNAIRLDSENGLAYALLAKLYQEQNKWEQADATFQIALQHSPNDALINYWYSLMLRSTGNFDKAIAFSTKAIGLDPLYPVIIAGHIGNLTYAGRFDQAQKIIQQNNQLFKTNHIWYWAKAFYHINRHEEALALRELEQGQQLDPNTQGFPTMAAYLHAKLGQPRPAQTCLDTLPNQPRYYPDRAIIYAGLGNRDSCLTYLEKGANTDFLPTYLKVSPLFEFLHRTPRFEAILSKVGLK